MKKYLFLQFIIAGLIISATSNGFANNVKIDTNPIIINTDANLDYSDIQFDMSWDNSWKDITNWDAVWVFAKYQIKGDSIWRHAYLSTNAMQYSVGTNNGVTPAFSVGTTNILGTDYGMGVFIFRNANGTGSINWDQVNLRWNYGQNGVLDGDTVTIKVFAIEMVYVPQGNFYVGDGTVVGADIKGQLENGTTSLPLLITSEALLTLGGGAPGSLGNNNASGMPSAPDDFNDVTVQTLPAAFPKGYNAFYCMKYEISQQEYVDFLNCLSRFEQSKHTGTNIAQGLSVITNRFVMVNNLTPLYRNGIACNTNVDPILPITFYNDLNNNSIADEADDGQTIAMNMVAMASDLAYADWTGLRFMTQLEYEKACRGPNPAIISEAAWGTAVYNQVTSISNASMENEIAANSPANCNVNSGFPTGPTRCGMFGTAISTRVQSGASYYGIMELTGNVSERIISIGNPTGRAFDGLHGDGMLNLANGFANVSNWPDNTTAMGSGTVGSSYIAVAANQNWRVSTRTIANFAQTIRVNGFGFRAVRTAP